MMRAFQDYQKTEAEIFEHHTIRNDIIRQIDIEIIGHLDNLCQLVIVGSNRVLMSGYNNTHALGYILQNLIEFFDLQDENGVFLSSIKNVPCRVILNFQGYIVGFGHFMKDRFVMIHDIIKVGADDENN